MVSTPWPTLALGLIFLIPSSLEAEALTLDSPYERHRVTVRLTDPSPTCKSRLDAALG